MAEALQGFWPANGDEKLWGDAVAGVVEIPAQPMPASSASDVGTPAWELCWRNWWLVRKPTITSSGFVAKPLKGDAGYTTAALEVFIYFQLKEY